MKVKALVDMTQTIGSLSIPRYAGHSFDLNPKDAETAAALGLLELLESLPKAKPKLETR